MGCDIHMYVEKKVTCGGKEFWIGADKYTIDEYYYAYPDDYDQEDPTAKYTVAYGDRVYAGRNYDLFSVLADVRNDYDIKPICSPRGLPKDVTLEIKAESDRWGVDGHSHSWFTLKELQDFDWENQYFTAYGFIPEEQYVKEFKVNGFPKSWSGGVWGDKIVKVEPDEMEDILKGIKPREKDIQYYVRVEWGVTYGQACREFLDNTIPKLRALAKTQPWRGDMSPVDPEKVRVVFWFDN